MSDAAVPVQVQVGQAVWVQWLNVEKQVIGAHMVLPRDAGPQKTFACGYCQKCKEWKDQPIGYRCRDCQTSLIQFDGEAPIGPQETPCETEPACERCGKALHSMSVATYCSDCMAVAGGAPAICPECHHAWHESGCPVALAPGDTAVTPLTCGCLAHEDRGGAAPAQEQRCAGCHKPTATSDCGCPAGTYEVAATSAGAAPVRKGE